MKKLSLLLVALAFVMFSCKPEIEKPTAVTKSVGEVTETTAKVVGQVTADGGAEVTERGICWNTEGNPEIIDYRTVDGTGLGTYSSHIPDLDPNTQYYVRAYATNEKGTSYGEELTFTTLKEIELPEVKTAEVTEITGSTAKCGGEVVSDGGGEVTARGVCWSTSKNPTIEDNKTEDCKGIGTFTSNITDLVPNTQYYVRAYATNEKGTSYGDELTFTTLKEIELPEVKTSEVTEITESEAKCGGEVVSDGGAKITARGICWSTSKNPTIEDDKTEDGKGLGVFTSKIPDLDSNTQYYVRAYATNEKGTAYGEEVSFTTKEIVEPEDPETPGDDPETPGDDPETPEDPETPVDPEQPIGPTVTTAEVTEITVNSAQCGGEVVSGGDAVVVARGVCYGTKQAPTVSDSYTIDGNGLGVFTSHIPGLVPNTQYYVRAYATDAKGVTSYGEEVSFVTLEKLLPTVTTSEVTEITESEAQCGGEVVSDGGAEVTSRGVCWSTSRNPTIEDDKTSDGKGVGVFTSNLRDLEPQTTYYVRAYATNEVGTSYGKEISFTTTASTGTINGYSWVDLGLSVKWATCNVGASISTEYGDYYAWGETTTKSSYDYDNCPTHNLSISGLRSQGYIDGEGNLTPQYDAATANWGGAWRMPTYDEQRELLNNCTWTWTTENDVNGHKVTGPNGNSIFLPAAGARNGSSLSCAGIIGSYWGSTPREGGTGGAYRLEFHSTSPYMNSYGDRHPGRSVRPVLE